MDFSWQPEQKTPKHPKPAATPAVNQPDQSPVSKDLKMLTIPQLKNLNDMPVVKFLRKYELWVSLLVFFSLWAGFLAYSHTLTSGYHLVDDHEMLSISQDLVGSNPISVSIKWITSDLNARFRPVYYIHRVFSIWLLGTNFQSLSILLLLMATVTSWLLYLFARKIKFGKITSFLFVFITLLGTQAAIWWRLGPSESIAIMWLALGLLFMAKSVFDAPKFKLRNTIIAIAAFIIASLSKEAFVILLPGIVFWWLLLYRQHSHVSWKATIKKHLPHVIGLGVVCVTELAIIFLKVGTTGIGYAGADSQSLTPRKILSTWKSLYVQNNPWLIAFLMGLFAVILIITFLQTSGTWKQKFKANLPQYKEIGYTAILVIALTLSQAVLYAKSGIVERYLIPGTLGLGFLAVYLICQIQKRFADVGWRVVITIALVIVTLFSLFNQYAAARSEAKPFASDGLVLNQAFDAIVGSTNPSDTIVIVADPAYDFEASISTQTYLSIQTGRNNTYYFPFWSQSADVYTPFQNDLGNFYVSMIGKQNMSSLQDPSQVRAVFTYKNTDEAFQSHQPTWFKALNFQRHEFGNYVVYTLSSSPQVKGAQTTSQNASADGTYTYEDLGIKFTINPAQAQVTRQNSIVYVHPFGLKPMEGQFVQVFTKDPSVSFEQAIRDQFLVGYPANQCFLDPVTSAFPDGPQDYVKTIIDYPPVKDSTSQSWTNARYCPVSYSKTTGITFFLGSNSVPDKFAFMSVGGFFIESDTSGQPWYQTFRFL